MPRTASAQELASEQEGPAEWWMKYLGRFGLRGVVPVGWRAPQPALVTMSQSWAAPKPSMQEKTTATLIHILTEIC